MRKEKGFTLIELMIVVLIIAILVAIAVPVFNIARENAWRRTCQANLRTIDGAIQTYYASYESFPSGFTGTLNSSHQLIQGNFLKAAPKCPKDVANGNTGLYTITGTYPDLSANCPGNYSGHSY
jgi:type IV pilus assembly protein PilA